MNLWVGRLRAGLGRVAASLGAALAASSAPAGFDATDTGPRRVAASELCVTLGTIDQRSDDRLSVAVPKMRAVVVSTVSRLFEARFTYLGPTAEVARLQSGELRRQFGLKLRAQDGCNLVYAMWRLEPASELIVSVKSNPGKHRHSECGTRGYQVIKPRARNPLPAVLPGDTHRLQAEIDRTNLLISVDGKLVWDGALATAALAFDGPNGIRSDNVRIDFELITGPPDSDRRGPVGACRPGADAED